MKKEDLKWAKNEWIGEKVVGFCNWWAKEAWADEPQEAHSVLHFFGCILTFFIAIVIGISILSILVYAPIHTYQHWEYLRVQCEPIYIRYGNVIEREGICDHVEVYNEWWYNLLSTILLSITAIEAAILSGYCLCSILDNLNTVGFYSKSIHDKRRKK